MSGYWRNGNINNDQITILVIEDNQDTLDNLSLFLEHQGYFCICATTGSQGLANFENFKPDLVLLDRMLPDGDGAKICKQIRRVSGIPILMLTGKVGSQDLVDGLEAGADEYIKKPFSHVELMARIKAHLRRIKAPKQTHTIKTVGKYQLNVNAKLISFEDRKLKLTKTEFDLLSKLLSHRECVFTREQLFTAVFNYNAESSDRTVDVHLHNVKRKISAISQSHHGITAIYGVGYKLSFA